MSQEILGTLSCRCQRQSLPCPTRPRVDTSCSSQSRILLTRKHLCSFYDDILVFANMLKKTYLGPAYNGIQQCCYCSRQSCVSSTSPPALPAQGARPQPHGPSKRRRYTEPSSWTSARGYATVRDSGRTYFRDNMNWPCTKSASYDTTPFVPSPYEIFDMHRSGAYGKQTKLKYYELVKIYHPDRNGASCEGVSQVERLERVRGRTHDTFCHAWTQSH